MYELRTKAPVGRIPVSKGAEADGVFTLTLEARDVVDPIPLLERRTEGFRWGRTKGKWEYRGELAVSGTGTFKWVEVKGAKTFTALTAELRKHGTIPSARWCAAIRRMPRGERPSVRAIADAAWAHTSGSTVFPCVYANGEPDFRPVEDGDYTGWQWLVKVTE